MLEISYRSIAEDYLGAALIRPVDYVIIINEQVPDIGTMQGGTAEYSSLASVVG